MVAILKKLYLTNMAQRKELSILTCGHLILERGNGTRFFFLCTSLSFCMWIVHDDFFSINGLFGSSHLFSSDILDLLTQNASFSSST